MESIHEQIFQNSKLKNASCADRTHCKQVFSKPPPSLAYYTHLCALVSSYSYKKCAAREFFTHDLGLDA